MPLPAALNSISASVLMAAMLATPTIAHADDAPATEKPLDEDILVKGRRETMVAEVVQVGAFRNRAWIDTPATISVITRSLMDAQNVQGLEAALRNTPGITQQTTSPFNTNTFNVRGVQIRADSNYRLNGGLPIINYAPMPVENKQRVELLKGVSALYYGFAMPSGILNLVTKRAGSQPVTSLYSTADTEGGFGGGFDVGRRFGADDRFGLRINGYGADLQSTTNGVSGHRQLISGAFDWQVDDRLTIKADVEYYHRSGQEPGGITLPTAVSGKITLPAVPDPSLRFAPENAVFTTWGMNAALRADYAISDKWSARVEGGVSEAHRNRMISTLGSVNLTTGAGRDAITYTPGQFWENRYGRAELAGEFMTGPLRHEILLGVARTQMYSRDQLQMRYATVAQNLYNPVVIPQSALTLSTTTINAGGVNYDTGAYVMDTIHMGPLQVIGGLRAVDYRITSASSTYTVRTVTPSFGLMLRPAKPISLYASYIEGLESAGTAPDTATNAGQVMDPAVSRQFEGGLRFEAHGMQASLAAFRIQRALAYTDTTNTYVLNGRAVHQGFEAAVTGKILPGVEVSISGQYLDATQRNTGSAAQDGKRVVNSARWSGSAFVQYAPAFLKGWSVNAGAYYTGDRYADALNLALLQGYTTYSAGFGHSWSMPGKHRLTLRASVENLTDKRYWATGGTTLYAGASRTGKMTLTLDL